MAWSADSLSCVVFSPPQMPSLPDALQHWRRVFGAPPQGYQQNPIAGAGNQANGAVGAYQMVIGAQAGRTELTLFPLPAASDANLAGALPSIRDVGSALDVLQDHSGNFISGEQVARVGLILNLFRQTNDQSEAAVQFCDETPITCLPPGVLELSFGLNSQKDVGHGNALARINRLCRWGTGTRHLLTIPLMIGMAAPQAPRITEVHGVTFTIDVNTMPRADPFPTSETLQLFGGLVAEARQIAAKGLGYFNA